MINANGAGDAYLAGLAHGFMQRWNTEQANTFAMGAAVVALSHLATINPDISENTVKRVLEESLC